MVREVSIETSKSEANDLINFKGDEEDKRGPSRMRQLLSHGVDGQETQRRERHLVNC